MSKIVEELVLYDRFTNTFTSYTKQCTMAASATQAAKRATESFAESQKTASTASDGLADSLKRLVGGYLGLQGLKSIVNLSDTMTSTTARLDMMNDGLQTTAELNQMIYDSAQRSRGSYLSMSNLVSQLGNLAGEAFGSNQETVAFAEQLNKLIAISGASGQAADAAIYQLTQGLSSGTLRGEELNSVLEQTPMVAKTIADYLGMSTGEMRELASEGGLTADVVKNAVLGAAEETNAAFEKMPMTWSQAWTMAKNAAIRALDPVLDAISWLANNLEVIVPLVAGVGAAFAIFVTAANWINICTAATNALTTAQQALQAVMATTWGLPLTIIAAVIGLLYAVVGGINNVAGTSISATGIIVGILTTALAVVGNLFVAAFNLIMDIGVTIANLMADVANFIGNVFKDPIGSVARLFFGLADTVLGVLQALASAIDTVFGSNLAGSVQGWRDSLGSWVDDTFGEGEVIMEKVNPQDMHLGRWEYGDAWNTGYNMGSNLFGGTSAGSNPLDATNDYLSSIEKSVGGIGKSASATEEDLKSLVDVAERRYVNQINLTSQTPVINVSGANTGHTAADRQNLANTLRDILLEQSAAGSTQSTFQPA